MSETAKEITFALTVCHTPWVPKRTHSMARLRAALNTGALPSGGVVAYHEETERAPWWLWSDRMQRWGAAQDHASHIVFGQDDAMAMPSFWSVLRALVAAHPNDVISLHCTHTGAMKLAREGVRWCATADGLIGLFYVMPHALLVEYLGWRALSLRAGGAQELAEDSHINVWAVATGRRILHPLPAPVDHDTSILSTNSSQTCGRPKVLWSDGGWLGPAGWAPEDLSTEKFWAGRVQPLGRQYAKTHWAARMVVPSFDRFDDVEADVCPPEYARFFHGG